MNIEVLTKGFEKTESIDQHLQVATWEAIEPFLKNDKDVHLKVVVNETSHRIEGRRHHFMCEILLKTAASRRVFKVKKDSTDFHEAVARASSAMKEVLRRRSGKRSAQRTWEVFQPAA